MTFELKQATTDDGAQIVCKTAGEGPLAVIFMPGWGSTKDYFDETIEQLSLDGLMIVSYDLRGQGDSAEGPPVYDSKRQAQDMLAVADAAGVERFVSVGHSMAAKYIQYLPVLAPERIIGQVLVAGCPAGPIAAPDEVIEEWAGFAGNYDALRQSHHSIITQPIRHEVSEKWIAQASKISHDVLHATLVHCFRDDFSTETASLSKHPATLVIGAMHDPFFPVELMQADVTAKIPGAREVFLDCGHEIPNELPTQTARLIESFLAGCTHR